MSTYIHFTDNQVEQAKNTDLAEFLRSQGEPLKRSGSEYEWQHSGAKITIRGNKWYHHYEQDGGTAIDFVKRFYDMDYPQAVQMLLGANSGSLVYSESKQKEKKTFALPEPNGNMRRVFAYLIKQRFIDRDVIAYFAHNKMLYEDAEYHNAIFVGYDEKGVARHAHKRGTYGDSTYKGNIDGSLSEYSFHHTGWDNRLYVFEAPIDMLSFISLYPKDWQQHSYVALCSVAEHAAVHLLGQNPNIQEVYLCLDHDKAGIEGCYRIAESIHELGDYQIKRIVPTVKDWNEQLKEKNGIEPLPSIPHPNMEYIKELCDLLEQEKYPSEKCPRYPFEKFSDMLEVLKKINPKNTEVVQEQTFDMSRLTLLFCIMRHRQLGVMLDEEWYTDLMFGQYKPHADNGGYKSRIGDIGYKLQSIIHDYGEDRIYTKSECETQIIRTLELGLDCLRLNAYVSLGQEQEQVPQMTM